MNKIELGAHAELQIALVFSTDGWTVFFPFHHDTEIDMILTKGPRVKRVQVKSIYDCGGILRANIDHKKGPKYSPDSVDTLVCIHSSGVWCIPMEDIEHETTLNFGRSDAMNLQQFIARQVLS